MITEIGAIRYRLAKSKAKQSCEKTGEGRGLYICIDNMLLTLMRD